MIVVLFKWRGPSTIARFIRTIVIDAINGVPGRPVSHVGEEVLERMSPAVTDDNPAPAPFRIAGEVLIVAALAHVLPRYVSRTGWTESMARLIVRCPSANPCLSLFTTARFGIAAPEIARRRQRLAAAIADTLPKPFPDLSLIRQSNDNEHAEPFANHERFHHTIMARSI